MSDSTSVDEARALLMRLRDAAPAATAARLTEVVALLESLAQENAYLTAMMAEDPPAATPPPPPEIRAGGESPPALDLLQGIDEALLGLGKKSIHELTRDDLIVPEGFTRSAKH